MLVASPTLVGSTQAPSVCLIFDLPIGASCNTVRATWRSDSYETFARNYRPIGAIAAKRPPPNSRYSETKTPAWDDRALETDAKNRGEQRSRKATAA